MIVKQKAVLIFSLLGMDAALNPAFALARGLASMGNEVVFLLQATSLVSAITVIDLTGAADLIRSKTFAVYEMYLTAAVLYLIMTYVLVYGFRLLEKRLNAYQRRPV